MTSDVIIKTCVAVATPFVVAAVGYFITRRLKVIEDNQWQNRKLIEKQLQLFDDIAPDLNLVFCFLHGVGYWKEITPIQLIQTKRRLDRTINIYRHLLGENFYSSYNDFSHLGFATYSGPGKDALIRSQIENAWGDRRTQSNYSWDAAFEMLFDPNNVASREETLKAYTKAMQELRDLIGSKS